MIKRFCLLVLVGYLCIIPIEIAFATDVVLGIISENVNLRQKPTKFSDSLGVLSKGTSVSILGTSVENRDGELILWANIVSSNGIGTGWINANFVTTEDGEVNINPTTNKSDEVETSWKKPSVLEEEFVELCKYGTLEQIKEAIKKVINVNVSIGEGATALGYAVSDNHNLEVVQILVEAGADVNNGHALMSATTNSNPEFIKFFIEKGIDVNAIIYEGGSEFTPLMMAARNPNPKIVTILLEAGADVNARADYNEETALMGATWNKNPEITAILIEAGADVNAKNNEGQTALMMAREKNNSRVVTLLVKAGTK